MLRIAIALVLLPGINFSAQAGQKRFVPSLSGKRFSAAKRPALLPQNTLKNFSKIPNIGMSRPGALSPEVLSLLTAMIPMVAPNSAVLAVPAPNQDGKKSFADVSAKMKREVDLIQSPTSGRAQGYAAGRRLEAMMQNQRGASSSGEVFVVGGNQEDAGTPKGNYSLAPSGMETKAAQKLPNPEGFFEQAYSMAVAKAQATGKTADQVYFMEATASLPSNNASWKFSFYLKDEPNARVADEVLVEFFKAGSVAQGAEMEISDDRSVVTSYKAKYSARQGFYRDVVSEGSPSFPLSGSSFKSGSVLNPDSALGWVKENAGMGDQVSVSFKMVEDPRNGEKDLWYHFYDEAGNAVRVNGRTGDRRGINADPLGRGISAPRKVESRPLSAYFVPFLVLIGWGIFAALWMGLVGISRLFRPRG